MTLILGQASPLYALHVGDRLVTKVTPNGTVVPPDDALSNKSILYVAPDGILAIGYTGLAHLEGVTTDQRLAEMLIGKRYARGEKPIGVSMGQTYAGLPIGPAAETLALGLNEVWAGHWVKKPARRYEFAVLAVGWQLSRSKRPRPMAFVITKASKSDTFELRRLPRCIGNSVRTLSVPGGMPKVVTLERFAEHWQKAGLDGAEWALVEAVRGVTSPFIGKNCVSILIPKPPKLQAGIRYFPHEEFRMDARGRKGPRIVRAAFTPWIISKSFLATPMAFTGTAHFTVEGVDVKLEAPYQFDSGVEFAMGNFEKNPFRLITELPTND